MKNFEEWLLETEGGAGASTSSANIAGFARPSMVSDKKKDKKKKDHKCDCGGACCSKH